jgi:hypothetical protein
VGIFAGGTSLLLSKLVVRRGAWKLSNTITAVSVLPIAFLGALHELHDVVSAKHFLGRIGVHIPPRRIADHTSVWDADGVLLAGAVGGVLVASLRSRP